MTNVPPIVRACAGFSIAVGAAALAGWLFDVAVLKSVVPGFVTMKANTALGFVLCGAALLLLAPESAPPRRAWGGRALALVAAAIGAITLGEEAFGWQPGIDELLLKDRDPVLVFASAPGRTSVPAAIAFLMLGAAFCTLDTIRLRRLPVSELPAMLVLALSAIAAVEYVFGHVVASPMTGGTRMALHTAVTFFVLSVGLLAARPDRGLLGAIRARVASPQERRVYVALGLSLLALLMAGGASYFAARESAARSDWVDHTHMARRQLALVRAVHLEMDSGSRGYVISGKREFLEPFERAREAANRLVPELARLVRDNAAQTARLATLAPLLRQKVEWAARIVEARMRKGSVQAADLVASGYGERLSEAAFATLAQMDAEESRLLGERAAEERSSIARLNGTLAASSLFALLVVGFAGVVIHRDFGERQRAENTIREQNALLEQRVLERTAQLSDSQARLEATVENLSEGVVVAGLDGQVLHFNRAAMRLHGFASREEYLRKLPEFATTFELTGPGTAVLPLDQWPLARVLRGEALRDVELGVRRLPDGENRIFSYGGVLVKDPSGRPTMAVLTVDDVTERKRSERRIRGQLEHLGLLDQITRSIGERLDLESIFHVVAGTLEDSLPVDFACVCLLDASGGALEVSTVGARSAALARELGLGERTAIGIDGNGLARCVGGQLVYEPDVNLVPFAFPERLASGGLRSVVMAPLKSESRVFGVLLAARRAAAGFESVECEFLRQLSEHVALAAHQAQLYEALRQAYDDLRRTQEAVMQEERLRALGQMASGIAHDINNALSPVALYTELMLQTEPNLGARARSFLETIRLAVDDVAQTVARMREFYRQRDDPIELAPVDLNRVVQQVLDLTRPRWRDQALRSGVVIEANAQFPPELPSIMGVESELREALTNLVLNAVDAMPDGGTLSVRTRLAEGASGGRVVVEVADTGVGMDEETRRRCLEPFFTTKGERGTGLGLAMVFGIVRRHGCDIEIDSAPGAGTTMRIAFSVPAAPAAPTMERPTAPAAPSRLPLLLVDDDPILLKSLRDALEAEGHAVTTAAGGQAGIEEFQASLRRAAPYAAVITDLGMPHVDGRKVATAVKQASPSTPVLLLTGWGQRMAAEGDTPPHVDRVLAKPPKLLELREALAAIGHRSTGGPVT